MGQSTIEKLITALVTPFQDAEDTLQDMLTERNVNTAVGIQLDAIGNLVGRRRNGITDDEIYRRYIRAQIAANKSDGTTNEMLAIASLVVFDAAASYHLVNTGIASFYLNIEDIVLDPVIASILFEFINLAVSGGVRPIVTFWTAGVDDLFTWGGDAADAGSGWGSTLDPDVGGVWASVAY